MTTPEHHQTSGRYFTVLFGVIVAVSMLGWLYMLAKLAFAFLAWASA